MMKKEKKGRESKKGQQNRVKTGSVLKELLSGSMISEKIILKNLGYVILVTFLTALYIANRFHAEKVTRELSKIDREVKDLRSESLSTSADLMYVMKQSEVYNLVKEKGLNLVELRTPPYKLIVNRK